MPSNEQLEALLKIMDKGAPAGGIRKYKQLGEDEQGNPLGIVVWEEA